MAQLTQYGWILAITTIAFVFSAFGNGANDVANSYATSVAARTLTMPQVGVLSIITEFIGAVALGDRVTDTIKNGIIDLDRFQGSPGALMVAMGSAEIGSATWLMVATGLGLPVSTTQTIVGALVGVGFATEADITWEWDGGSVSQIAASWGIAPCLSAAFAAILFGTLKFGVLERKDSFKWGMRLIPWYLAFTAGVLALFITVETPGVATLEDLGAGTAVGIVLGTFFGVLLIAYVFFMPYFHRRLVKNDYRIRVWHLPLGPLLRKENPPLYWPGDARGGVVKDYYTSAHLNSDSDSPHLKGSDDTKAEAVQPSTLENGDNAPVVVRVVVPPEPEERFLAPYKHLPIYNPRRLWSYVVYFLLQGVTRDCVDYHNDDLKSTHQRAVVYDNKVEHLWTYAQVASAILMSIAHGSNDVANAVGPWVASYRTYQAGEVDSESDTPIFILVVAGLLLGIGFWFYGFRVVRSLGNRLTKMSPTRGYAAETGAAITVLLASRLGLPVSTTQCLTGAVIGVALMNLSLRAVNWRQVAIIFSGWILTLPIAGLIAGLICVMAVNAPSFD